MSFLDPSTWLYPALEPYHTDRLTVSPLHTLHYEECGNPKGTPVIFIHGGPGGGCGPEDRRFFNPKRYRIILLDQRGSGKSTPAGCLEENTTWHLVQDLEALREHLKLEKWHVFGGSWGSTLALTYAITHTKRVLSLVLRGIFMIRKKEIRWFYQEGANFIYPDQWEPYQNHIPNAERGDFLKAYYTRLTHSDPQVQLAAARPWTQWEISTSRFYTPPHLKEDAITDEFSLKFARIECHYFTHQGFFSEDEWILNRVPSLKGIPAVIVQGRYDVVCPPVSAWELHKAWPEARLYLTPDAGHASRDPGNARALVASTDRFASI